MQLASDANDEKPGENAHEERVDKQHDQPKTGSGVESNGGDSTLREGNSGS